MRRTVRCQFCGCRLKNYTERAECRCEVCDKAYMKGYRAGQQCDLDKVLEKEIDDVRNLRNQYISLKDSLRDESKIQWENFFSLGDLSKKVTKLGKELEELTKKGDLKDGGKDDD